MWSSGCSQSSYCSYFKLYSGFLFASESSHASLCCSFRPEENPNAFRLKIESLKSLICFGLSFYCFVNFVGSLYLMINQSNYFEKKKKVKQFLFQKLSLSLTLINYSEWFDLLYSQTSAGYGQRESCLALNLKQMI